MQFSKIVLALAFLASASAFVPASVKSAQQSALRESPADLSDLAGKLNPAVKFFDPLNLAEAEFWEETNEATIGFLRHAEIKHGRVAMFAFVGYIVQAQGITWPDKMTLAGDSWPVTAGNSVPAQWDALPEISKWQIILVIGFLELWGEAAMTPHYMRGGKPGAYPSLTAKDSMAKDLPHPVPLDLFDPFKLSKNASPEKKAKGLLMEINNGRLAQIGIFGFLAESKVPGSVPALKGLIPAYDGDYMAPFAANFHIFN